MKRRATSNPSSWQAIAAQCALLTLVVAILLWLTRNTINNLAFRGIAVGFDFLTRDARFPLPNSILPYSSTNTFAWAFVAGITNTLFLSISVALSSTIAGFLIAMGQRASHPLVSMLATAFVELIRNSPLIVLLLFTYAVFTNGLPQPVLAHAWHGLYLTNRGIYGPFPHWTGSIAWDMPRLIGTNIFGGWSISPEFAAAFVGLTIYSAALAAEIIRGGLAGVDRIQWDASRALGLSELSTLRLVILPQAVRLITPPMISQTINIVKNSTLALVVGYAEINFVTATTIDQTGQALEATAILVSFFLVLGFVASWLIGKLDHHSAGAES